MSLVLQNFVPSLPGADAPGFAAAAPAEKAGDASPLGAFGAILEALAKDVPVVGPLIAAAIRDTPKANAETIADAVDELDAKTTQSSDMTMSASLGDLLSIDLGAEAKPTAPAAVAPQAEGDATEDPRDLKTLVEDLGDLLAAVDTALDAGNDPEPAVIEKLTATLNALATVLGIAASPVASDAPQLPTSALTLPIPTTEPLLPTAPAETSSSSPPPQAGGPVAPMVEALSRIVQRFTDSGRDIPQKLAEVATAIANPALAPAIAAKLGVEAGAAIAAELAQLMPDAAKPQPAPTPQQFALPELKAPVILAPDQKPAPKGASPSRSDMADAPEIKLKPAAHPDTPRPVDPAPRPQPVAVQTAQPQEQQQPPQAPQAQVQAIAITAAPATVRAVHAAYQVPPAQQQINIPQLAFDIARHVQAGQSRFEIRLDPPELGRIDVKLDIDGGGTLNARLTVERAETLDLLQRDHRQLERALQQAGVDASKTNLEFSLKQQTPFDRQPGQPGSPWLASRDDEPAVPKGDAPALPVQLYRATATAGGVNIFV